jgi:hypothetical protein
MQDSDLLYEEDYDEGRRLFLNHRFDEALEQFKGIYVMDCAYCDVAEIIEDSYDLSGEEWQRKYRARFVKSDNAA